MPALKVIVRQKIRINYIIGQVYAGNLASTIQCYCKNHYKLHFHLQFKNKKSFLRSHELSIRGIGSIQLLHYHKMPQIWTHLPTCSHLINFGSTLLAPFLKCSKLNQIPPFHTTLTTTSHKSSTFCDFIVL